MRREEEGGSEGRLLLPCFVFVCHHSKPERRRETKEEGILTFSLWSAFGTRRTRSMNEREGGKKTSGSFSNRCSHQQGCCMSTPPPSFVACPLCQLFCPLWGLLLVTARYLSTLPPIYFSAECEGTQAAGGTSVAHGDGASGGGKGCGGRNKTLQSNKRKVPEGVCVWGGGGGWRRGESD